MIRMITFDGLNNIHLPSVWFFLVGILLTGYAILDGFDLGVGILHLFTRTDEERQLMIATIGPVWDGNEVWLVTAGGALFAAFPDVYATVFSGFYTPMMLLLVTLIMRAIAIEFRSKMPMAWWRQSWDVCFALGSLLSTVVFGVAFGNIALGIPLLANKEFAGTTLGLFNPYALLIGLTTVALFTMHAAIYVVMKTEGPLQEKVRGWVSHTIGLFMALFGLTTVVTLLYIPHLCDNVRQHPELLILAIIMMGLLANVPREMHYRRDGRAFICSCLAILVLMGLYGLETFPNLVVSSNLAAPSLTVFNASSSTHTLQIMTLIAGLASPLIMAYTFCVYWVFRGKVRLDY
jgi:cytochrome bd ubiquinol oxidase subunit II